MFNLNRSQNGDSNNKDVKSNWLKYSSSEKKEELLNSMTSEENKIREIVVEMLKKEFGNDITQIKGYDYLVDSVVNKLKKKQLETTLAVDETK